MLYFMGFGCVLLHFASRFAAFYLAFWCILQCVLVHFAVRLAAYCTPFSSKTHYILQQIARNLVQMAVL